MSQGATPEGTQRYSERFRELAAEGHFRQAQGLTLSSLGIGTYLGQPNDNTDASYSAALVEAGLAGINVFDTAINYMEKSLAKSLQNQRRLPDAGHGHARGSQPLFF